MGTHRKYDRTFLMAEYLEAKAKEPTLTLSGWCRIKGYNRKVIQRLIGTKAVAALERVRERVLSKIEAKAGQTLAETLADMGRKNKSLFDRAWQELDGGKLKPK